MNTCAQLNTPATSDLDGLSPAPVPQLREIEMAAKPGFDRRALLRGGLTVTAAGALGVTAPGTAGAGLLGPDAAEPRVYTTAEWGARPPSSPTVIEDHPPTYIAVHHTFEPGNSEDYSLEHAFQICRDIQNFHMDGNGWSDTGQQFTNSRGGYVLEGRHESLNAVRGGTQHVQGANVGGRNSEVIGIENEGDYRTVDVPQALWDSLVALVAWIAGQYGTAPENIQGHRDFNSTECPGDVLYGRLPELRQAVAATLGLPAPARLAEWPLLKPGMSGRRVLAAQHLLRAKGASVPADGVFGASTKDAVRRIAEAHGNTRHVCAATRRVDETGYLGSDVWPLIAPRVQPGENSHVAEAVRVLTRGGTRLHSQTLGTLDWKRLLD